MSTQFPYKVGDKVRRNHPKDQTTHYPVVTVIYTYMKNAYPGDEDQVLICVDTNTHTVYHFNANIVEPIEV